MSEIEHEKQERRQVERRKEPFSYPAGATFGELPVIVRAIGLVGVPAAIALFLVWMGSRDLPHISQQVDQIEQEVLYNRKLIEEQNLKADSQLKLLRWICSNTAKSDLERQRCFD